MNNTKIHFNREWLDNATWIPLDEVGALKRWRVADDSGRWWLLVTGVLAHSPEAWARLEREYALAPCLDVDWALVPRTLINTRVGPALILPDDQSVPLSTLASADLSVDTFFRLAIATVSTLCEAHQAGLIHGDIRPEHLILSSNGLVRLTGFALSTLGGRTPCIKDNGIQPNIAYLAPELAGHREQGASVQSDLYALGVTLFQLLTGRLPFDADNPAALLHQHLALEASLVTDWRPDLPIASGRMIARLLRKEPHLRSTSTEAVEAELRRHFISWQEQNHPDNGMNVLSPLPVKSRPRLIGRESELAVLRDSIDSLANGRGGTLLIQGEAGMGKTALINVLEQTPFPSPYLLARGKCEILEQGFPYDALAAALSSLCQHLSSGTAFERRYWRQRLRNAIGHHGNVLTRLIPELEILTGPIPISIVPLPSEARRHLHRTLQCLMAAMASADHPLVLFLDDLQWIDRETLVFLKELDSQSFNHLLLIGTYRSGAAETNSELRSFIQHCRQLTCETTELVVGPFDAHAAIELFASEFDLNGTEKSLLENHLAQHDQMSPLYLNQAIAVLRETRAAPPTVAGGFESLMHARFERLPAQTLDLLSRLAILGNQTPTALMADICEMPLAQVLTLLKPAFNTELIREHRQELLFTHDAIGEAARARIPEAVRNTMRLNHALTMADKLPSEAAPETLFRIASLLLQAPIDQIAPALRPAIINLLFQAAELAKASFAASKAIDYLRLAFLLREGTVDSHKAPNHTTCILYAQCLILNADYAEAEVYIGAQLSLIDRPALRSELYRLRCEIYMLQGDYSSVVTAVNEGLVSLDEILSSTLIDKEPNQARRDISEALNGRPPAVFLSLQPLVDSRVRAIVELLAAAIVPGSSCHPGLMLNISSRILQLTLQHGVSEASVYGLAWFGVAIAYHFEDYQQGIDYAELAVTLSERSSFSSSRGVALIAQEQVGVWTRPLPFALECVESAYQLNLAKGSPSFACIANNHIVSDLLVMGAPIERILRQIDSGLKLAEHLEFKDAQNVLYVQALYIRRLAGDVSNMIPIPTPAELARRVAASQAGPLHFWWELFEGLFHYLEDSQILASRHLDNAWALAWAAPVHIHMIDLALFSVLNRAALQSQNGQVQNFETPMHRLHQAAKSNPHHFADRLALAEAEICRVTGHHLEAIRHYENAIGLAGQCGAVHIQGLAHELESRFLLSLNLDFGTQAHLRQARDAWRRWGAGKLADQLETAHEFLRDSPSVLSTDMLPSPQHLGSLAITTACQALSREIEPDALIKTLLTNATLHAGATYAALLLIEDAKPTIVATCSATQKGIDVCLREDMNPAEQVPLNLIQYTLHERTPLAINGAEALMRFRDEGHLLRLEQASIACIPLLKKNAVLGVLYLENTLISGVFTPNKIDLLELLAAQAAISLRNAQLYQDLLNENSRRRASESKLSRTQAMLAIGQAVSRYSTFVWQPESPDGLWTPALLSELGLCHAVPQTLRHDPATLACPDDRERFSKTLQRALQDQSPFRLCFRTVSLLDGTRDLEMAGEPDAESGGFVGVILDITQRRQTEMDLRAARSQLERTSQATALGELAASISHEVNQPLASILSNAAASIRWLDRNHPQIEDALEGMRDILSEGQRAANIIGAMRALARQDPPQCQTIALDKVIHHVISIIEADLEDQNVKLVLELASDNMAWGDAIQIQQVLHNLITNAVEAMEALPSNQRRLFVSTCPIHDATLVIIEDSGPGISSEDEAKVFQAFYSTKPTGMGMGLAICSSIIAAHGGALRFTQGREGESLLFFTLPKPNSTYPLSQTLHKRNFHPRADMRLATSFKKVIKND